MPTVGDDARTGRLREAARADATGRNEWAGTPGAPAVVARTVDWPAAWPGEYPAIGGRAMFPAVVESVLGDERPGVAATFRVDAYDPADPPVFLFLCLSGLRPAPGTDGIVCRLHGGTWVADYQG
jgi:hypothetical protein